MAIRIAGRDYMPKEVFIKSEITLVKKLIKWQDIPFVSVEVQRLARDAFNIRKMCVLTRKHLIHQVNG